MGATGPTGPTGPGPTGPTGSTGPQGPAGGSSTGVVTDTPSGTINNYAPAGFASTTAFLDLSPSAATIITGLAGGSDGQIVTISNLSGTFSVTLNQLDNGSTAANRFRIVGNIVLSPQYNSVSIKYSASLTKWVQL